MRGWVLALAGAFMGFACADFVDPVLGICGNRIVESGEVCDDPDDPRCADASNPHPCRILCGSQADGDPCDPGHQCGSDGVCRTPSGTFADPVAIDEDGIQRLEVAALDGDGRADLVAQFADGELDGMDVKALHLDIADGLGVLEVTLREPVASDFAIGDLDADGLDDVLVIREVAVDSGPSERAEVSLFMGNAEQARRPAYLSTLPSSGSIGRLLVLTPEPERVLELVDSQTTRLWSGSTPSAVGIPALEISVPDLGARVPVADLADNGSCIGGTIVDQFDRPEFVLAVAGAAAVLVGSTCADEEGVELLGDVSLPGGLVLGSAGAFLIPANADSTLDLIVQTEGGGLQVAYGVGDGSFDSDPLPPAADGDGLFAATALISDDAGLDTLLAVGDFDEDGSPEFALESRYLASPDQCGAACDVTPWPLTFGEAAAVDVNGDGRLDLAGLAEDNVMIGLAGSQGPAPFEVHVIELNGVASSLAIGDFDRDTVQDLAFAEEVDDHPNPADTVLSVLYGGQESSWRTAGYGPFVDVTDLVVEAGTTLVARTADLEGRPAGAFVRPDEDPHLFAERLRAPATVRSANGPSAAALAVDELGGETRVTALGFVSGSLSPHDIVQGDSLGWGDTASFFAVVRAIDLDGDQIDELLILGPDAVSNVQIAERDPATGGWVIAQQLTIGFPFARRPAQGEHGLVSTPSGGAGSFVAIQDVDFDGDVDAVVTTDESVPRVVLLRNESGSVVAVELGVELVADAPEPGSFGVVHIVPWVGDGASTTRFLVGGAQGAGVAELVAGESILRVRQWTEDEVVALAAADVDGDGLPDLVVATDAELLVLRAEETIGEG